MAKAISEGLRDVRHVSAAHGAYVESDWRDSIQSIKRRRSERAKPISTRKGRWILAALLIGFASGYGTARAADLCPAGKSVDVHLTSYHTAQDANYSNANYGLGFTCQRTGYALSAGVYRNSFEDTSAYVMASVETKGSVRFGLGAGVASGYDEPVKVIGGAFMAVDLPARFVFTTLVGPTIEKRGAVFHFVVSRGF